MVWKRALKRLFILGLTAVGTLAVLYVVFRPAPMARQEIFQGVFLTVEDLAGSDQGTGRIVIAEIHWDTPGVRLVHRDFDKAFSPQDPASPHYRLTFADWALMRHQPAILVNTTRYFPEAYLRSLPGMPVRSLETLVVDKQVSHLHDHSYLLYWDREGAAHMLTRKPPDPESLAAAVLGIGLQGIQVNEGRAAYNALSSLDLVGSKTFLGVDPERRILWLFAFENASGRLMIDRAVAEGVVFGGQVDSGDGTSLLVGFGANGVLPHTGIRYRRPLGPYLKIYAEPLGTD